LSGDGEATIVDSGLANCDAAGDLEFTSPRRDDNEFAVCRLTAEHSQQRCEITATNMDITIQYN